jgi:hypothetical protein
MSWENVNLDALAKFLYEIQAGKGLISLLQTGSMKKSEII